MNFYTGGIHMRFLILLFLLLSTFAFAGTMGIVTQTTTNATGTSTKFLDRNDHRAYLMIQNVGTDTIIVKFNSAHSSTEGVQIPAGGNYEPLVAPKESVYIKTASGTQAVTVIEGI